MEYELISIGVVLLIGAALLASYVKSQIIYEGNVGLLYRNGTFERQLEPGKHRWLDIGRATKLFTVPTVRTPSLTTEVSVITKDQFSFRIGLMPIVILRDPQAYQGAQLAPQSSIAFPQFGLNFPELVPTLQANLLSHYSKLALDEVIADPTNGLEKVKEALQVVTHGAEIVDLLVTSLTMPPEVRKMFTEVERAKRESLASLERARGEQASLRALANAARALQDNPQLAHLRLLQTMEGAKGTKTFILGSAGGMHSSLHDLK